MAFARETQAMRIAVVTGANKGIGLEIVRQLASGGVAVVILTARDEQRGLQAVEKLKAEAGVSAGRLEFHQLDVADAASIAKLAAFIETRFGKLDILVNNAAIGGLVVDPCHPDVLISDTTDPKELEVRFYKAMAASTQTYENARKAIDINFYGAKRACEALLPLLRLSPSPRIVNVTSDMGMLEHFKNKGIRKELDDPDHLTEDRLDGILQSFFADFKDDKLEENGWPEVASAYMVAKAALNAYTRILAKANPGVYVNCVHPGFIKTDLTWNNGFFTPEVGAANVVRVALLPDGSPSGLFYYMTKVSSF